VPRRQSMQSPSRGRPARADAQFVLSNYLLIVHHAGKEFCDGAVVLLVYATLLFGFLPLFCFSDL
jgi:hypothetical protein